MPEVDEQLDLVDGTDTKIGTIWRSQLPSLVDNGGRYVRTACAFIRNQHGEYWIPRRTADKRIVPSGLDFSMSEHMDVDESYVDAAVRGFNEELAMDIRPHQLRLLGMLGPVPKAPYFAALYLHETNVTPDYNPADFQDARWMTPEATIATVKEGTAAKDLLVPALKLALISEGRL
jgi:isopentenyldiphosphate isomerase